MTLSSVQPENGMDDSGLWRSLVARTINGLIRGGGGNVGTVTLSSTTQTTLTDVRIGVTSKIILIAENAGAASVLGSGSTYVQVTKNGNAVIYHTAGIGNTVMGYAVVGS